MDGILLVDKPSGWTSFDVVAKVRGLMRQAARDQAIKTDTKPPKSKVGHTGTLDPLATGLLVLMLGKYTKKVPQYTKLDKTYDVTMCLGQTSTTGDEEGEKRAVNGKQPALGEVEAALDKFVGDIMQTPPAFSAIKINGQRAYDLARQGKVPDLQPRPVTIRKIELTSYKYPFAEFTAQVSSGTYIRSLVEDVGHHLGTGAYMSGLRRTRVGGLDLRDSIAVQNLDIGTVEKSLLVE